jgi:hypothetical protein
MDDREYIKELEKRLERVVDREAAMQSSLASILSERELERKDFHDRDKILRDNFAMCALQGCLAYSHVNPMSGNYHENADPEDVAMMAYKYADAMLKARED